MVQIATKPVVEDFEVLPDFKTQHEAWSWLKDRATPDQIDLVKEKGTCDVQTITKVEELSAIMGVPMRSFR